MLRPRPPKSGASASIKSTAKRDRIVDALRQEIISGKLAPDSQLPAQPELARRFRVSPVTVGLALNRLTREGFVRAHHRRGTFVTAKPPHVNNYALVFWNDPASPHSHSTWTKYYTALTNEAIAMQRDEGRRMLLFHGIDQHTDTDDRQRLEAYIRAHRLCGIIFANLPIGLEGTPILESAGVPRVAFMGKHMYPQVRTVSFDGHMWLDKALDYLASRGRKRVAIVMLGMYKDSDELLSAAITERGMECPFYWRQIVPFHEPRAIRNCVQLLMYGAGAQRPDGLVIADDNFVEPAMAALMAAGVRLPDDVEVVAHCNFPWPPTALLPVKRLGYDIRAALQTAVDLIDRQRRGEQVPEETKMPALLEEELPAKGAAMPVSARSRHNVEASVS